jgi:hypothetical protein
VLWLLLSRNFFKFLKIERGWIFGIVSIFWTFVDHLIMSSGIAAGFLKEMFVSSPSTRANDH